MNVYCAGPLFNDAERAEMLQIAEVLESAGHQVFLPQRDGLEFASLHPRLTALGVPNVESVLGKAIFSLDVHKLLHWANVVVANLNGRVADEGTVVEAALAWHSGKVLVLYKADARSMLGGADNPMVTGLGEFQVCSATDQLNDAIARAKDAFDAGRVDRVVATGAEIAGLLQRRETETNIPELLARTFD
ncbi:hypothetical protein BH11PSE13_BH11PSE13_43400 [soil metagenome]